MEKLKSGAVSPTFGLCEALTALLLLELALLVLRRRALPEPLRDSNLRLPAPDLSFSTPHSKEASSKTRRELGSCPFGARFVCEGN